MQYDSRYYIHEYIQHELHHKQDLLKITLEVVAQKIYNVLHHKSQVFPKKKRLDFFVNLYVFMLSLLYLLHWRS